MHLRLDTVHSHVPGLVLSLPDMKLRNLRQLFTISVLYGLPVIVGCHLIALVVAGDGHFPFW
jgi:hypothetical protein